MDKKILIAIIVFIGIIIFLLNPQKPIYFDDNAEVMYFYSDGCHVCDYIKPALQQLGEAGYRVKPINVAVDRETPQQYSIQGTPTFIGPDGEKIVGMLKGESVEQFKLRLQEFLDKY